jgi:diaminopimelate epimerase/GNAT superfamily N-acetyltransferase
MNMYREAFADPPYSEAFSDEEAREALEYILEQKGNLLIGKLRGKVVSLVGGYAKPDGVYYIEELAVMPDQQGNGYGRTTFQALLATTGAQAADRLEVRTTAANTKAIKLYESAGFTQEIRTELVAQMRQDNTIGLDERVYLSKPPFAEKERLANLKRIAIAYPSGNTTAVVFDQLLSADRKVLNNAIMDTWKNNGNNQPEIEQCCFISQSSDPRAIARVEMFGGEFCGNATRSAAWLITSGKDYKGLIEVSGAARPLEFTVKNGDVSVEMPLPNDRTLFQLVPEGTLVQLDGITQLVVADQDPRQLLTQLLRENKYSLASQPAVGVSSYNPSSSKAKFCVWVNEVDTIFDETACGSGTSAIGIAVTAKDQTSTMLPVTQPSGETITTETTYDNDKITKSTITGKVNILYDGEMKLA